MSIGDDASYKRYQCKSCPREFTVYSTYWAHERREHKGHRYYCCDCNAPFRYVYQLLSHQVHRCPSRAVSKQTPAPALPVAAQSVLGFNPWL